MDATLALQLLSVLLDHLQEISAAIATATAAGQTSLTPDAWAQIIASDDRARAALTATLAGLKPPPPVQAPAPAPAAPASPELPPPLV
jgi:hypothetical protein